VEDQIADEFARGVTRGIDELSGVINGDDPASINADSLQAAIRSLRHFFTVFRMRGQKVHFN
jgi:hypothetical protein